MMYILAYMYAMFLVFVMCPLAYHVFVSDQTVSARRPVSVDIGLCIQLLSRNLAAHSTNLHLSKHTYYHRAFVIDVVGDWDVDIHPSK